MNVSALSKTLIFLSGLLYTGFAHAYIGPGLGAGAIAAVLGVIGSVLIGIFALFYYPIKRAMKKKKTNKPKEKEPQEDPDDQDSDKG